MQALLQFFRTGKSWLHVSLALGTLALLLMLTLSWLKNFTSHNEQVEVPDFTGMQWRELDAFLADKEVNVQIVDSIYDAKQKKGVVLRQEPEPGTAVKHNRTVYLYVTSLVAPQMLMPKLIDRSERQARLILENYGLKLGPVTEQIADCNGCVIRRPRLASRRAGGV